MSDPLTYWDDQEFVHNHHPEISQAYIDGETAMGRPNLIPDGRLLRPSLHECRIRRWDVVPETQEGNLFWRVFIADTPHPYRWATGESQEDAFDIAQVGVQDAFRHMCSTRV